MEAGLTGQSDSGTPQISFIEQTRVVKVPVLRCPACKSHKYGEDAIVQEDGSLLCRQCSPVSAFTYHWCPHCGKAKPLNELNDYTAVHTRIPVGVCNVAKRSGQNGLRKGNRAKLFANNAAEI